MPVPTPCSTCFNTQTPLSRSYACSCTPSKPDRPGLWLCPVPLLQRILNVEYGFPPHTRTSPECRDLLRRILVADPTKRMGIPQIMQHPWSVYHHPPFAPHSFVACKPCVPGCTSHSLPARLHEQSVCQCVCLPACMSVCVSVSACLPARLPACLPACPPACPSVCLPACCMLPAAKPGGFHINIYFALCGPVTAQQCLPGQPKYTALLSNSLLMCAAVLCLMVVLTSAGFGHHPHTPAER